LIPAQAGSAYHEITRVTAPIKRRRNGPLVNIRIHEDIGQLAVAAALPGTDVPGIFFSRDRWVVGPSHVENCITQVLPASSYPARTAHRHDLNVRG
jgi:hypothetical protein